MLLLLAKMQLRNEDFTAASRALEAFVAMEPQFAEGQYLLGTAQKLSGHGGKALVAFQAAVDLKPKWFAPLRDLAWILATHPDARIRNPTEAVRLAKKSISVAGKNIPQILDTLSVAYAADGRFDQTIEVIESAIDLDPDGSEDNSVLLRQRLINYQQGIPIIDETLLEKDGESVN